MGFGLILCNLECPSSSACNAYMKAGWQLNAAVILTWRDQSVGAADFISDSIAAVA